MNWSSPSGMGEKLVHSLLLLHLVFGNLEFTGVHSLFRRLWLVYGLGSLLLGFYWEEIS